MFLAWCTVGFEEVFECVESFGPEPLVGAQPLCGCSQWGWVEATYVAPAGDRAMDEPGLLQDFHSFEAPATVIVNSW
jgi:hypothetical protein